MALLFQAAIPPDIVNKFAGAADLAALFFLAMVCVLIGAGLTAVTLAARAFWNDIADQVDLIMLGHSPLRRLLMGMINGFGLFVIAVVMLKLGPLRLIGIALIFTLLILTLIGLMSEMALIGRRVLALRSVQSSILAQIITGGMTITLAFLLPFVGQVMLLAILFRSFGTSVYWLFKRGKLPANQARKNSRAVS